MRLPRLLLRVAVVPVTVAAMLLAVPGAGPASAQKIKRTFWGLHANEWEAPLAPTIRTGSANLTTSRTYWRDIEVAPGVFDFSRLDVQVAGAERLRARPMIVLGHTPSFYSDRPNAVDYYSHVPPTKRWKRFVRKLATRYGDRLDYQIWPEPNISQNWKGTPQELARLTAVAARIIHDVAPRAKVVGPAMTLRLKGQRQRMLKYYRSSVGGERVHTYLDAIAIDPFPMIDGRPEHSYALMQEARSLLRGIGVRGVPFWNNEINYGVAGAGNTSEYTLGLAKQQAYVIRTYALSAGAKMKRTYWLGWFTTDTMAVDLAEPDHDLTDGGDDLAPAQGLRTVQQWMDGTKFRGCERNRKGVWSCTMTTRREVRTMYWHPTRTVRVRPLGAVVHAQDQDARTMPSRARYWVDFRPVLVVTSRTASPPPVPGPAPRPRRAEGTAAPVVQPGDDATRAVLVD